MCFFIYLSIHSESVEGNLLAPNSTISLVSREIEIECSEGIVEFKNDTHGGFHNDGIAFYIIEFENTDILNEIVLNEYWNELPMGEVLEQFIDRLVRDENSKQYLPVIEEGYYFFYDRQSDNKSNKNFNPEIIARSSQNFTIAIYDVKQNKIYYCKYDS